MIDIYKCFDQIVPLLVHTVCLMAGMPARVVLAYRRLMSRIKVVNCLALGVGLPYKKSCGIPEGCPWPMAMLALQARPWILAIETYTYAIPRVLADDLCLWTQEEAAPRTEADQYDYVEDMTNAIHITITFLVDLGGKAAQSKSAIMASDAGVRKHFRAKTWGTEQAGIPVRLAHRDLGAYFNSTGRRQAGTLVGRFHHAVSDAHRIGNLPRTLSAKERLL